MASGGGATSAAHLARASTLPASAIATELAGSAGGGRKATAARSQPQRAEREAMQEQRLAAVRHERRTSGE